MLATPRLDPAKQRIGVRQVPVQVCEPVPLRALPHKHRMCKLSLPAPLLCAFLPWDRSSLKGVGIGVARSANAALNAAKKNFFVPQGVLRQWDELGFGRPAGAPARLQEVGGPKGPSPEPSLGRARARTRAGPVRAGTPLFKLPGKTTKYPPLDGCLYSWS